MAEFHFLRPLWLLMIPIAVALCLMLWRRAGADRLWHTLIEPQLLAHLIKTPQQTSRALPQAGLFIAWCLTALALAGPAWEKRPQTLHQSQDAWVLLLDLSPSMLAQDIKPSRLERSRLKIIDWLKQRGEGSTGLIAYAGEAHVVSPLTDDSDTLINLLPALSPSMMPLQGSHTEMALELALELFREAAIGRGNILLVTDGVAPEAIDSLDAQLQGRPFKLAIYGVGEPEGAPIPLPQGGFAKDRQGNLVIARHEDQPLRKLAASRGGIYVPLRTADDADLAALEALSQPRRATREVEREFDLWREAGIYLTLPLLPLALLAFRRGLLLSPLLPFSPLLPLVWLALASPSAEASRWQNLWTRPDQRGQQHFSRGEHAEAAEAFADPHWRGSALYRQGDYEAAARAFAGGDRAIDDYNRGNALARSGQIEQAIAAYESALSKDPSLTAAQQNLDLLKALQPPPETEQASSQAGEAEPDPNSNSNPGESRSGDNRTGDERGQQQPQQANPSGQQAADESAAPENRDQAAANSSAQRDSGESNSADESESEPSDTAQQSSLNEHAEGARDDQQARADEERQPSNSTSAPQAGDADSTAEREQRQALEQWLRQVPDDPSGLLRNKFLFQHRQRRQQYRSGEWQPPENKAHQRW